MEKQELEKLTITELKNLCKKEGLNFNKKKEELIFALDEYYRPMSKSKTTQKKPSKLKIKSVSTDDNKGLIDMSKLVEQKKAKRLYYANNNFYFEVE